MWIELFLCLFLGHLVADFLLQSNKICLDKSEKKWLSFYQYGHAVVVFGLSWLVSWDIRFWWCAIIIGVLHFAIDIWKSYRERDKVVWFVLDQVLHIGVIALVSLFWCSNYEWRMPFSISLFYVLVADIVLICWKPANIFIKLMLRHFSVNMPENSAGGFNAGALIGTIERWLILIFVIMQHYEALGLLIAAKSIIRFSEKDTAKTEYVLAGTLLSIFIAVLGGLVVRCIL